MRRLVKPAVLLLVATAIATALWFGFHDITGVRRAAPPPTMIAILPPPPPPPPTPPKPPEPEKQVETPQPQEQPKPDNQAPPPPLTINGPAQAGGDSFGIQAGSGGGMALGGPAGTGQGGGGDEFADAAYSRFLSSQIQQAVQDDDNISRQVFTADVDVWVDSSGRVTRARISKGTGDASLDKSLLAVLEHMDALSEAPPGDFKFPRRIAIRGRRGV